MKEKLARNALGAPRQLAIHFLAGVSKRRPAIS